MKHDGGVFCLAFGPDGTRIATASGDQAARLWPIAPLLLDDPAWIAAYVVFRTNMKPDENGVLRPATDKEIAAAVSTVFGAPDAQPYFDKAAEIRSQQVRTYHAITAGEFASLGRWFAAAFHLKCLVAHDPHDKDLRRRLSEAYAKQGLKDKAAAALIEPGDSKKPEPQ